MQSGSSPAAMQPTSTAVPVRSTRTAQRPTPAVRWIAPDGRQRREPPRAQQGHELIDLEP